MQSHNLALPLIQKKWAPKNTQMIEFSNRLKFMTFEPTVGSKIKHGCWLITSCSFSNLKVFFQPIILLNNLFNAILVEEVHFGWNADDVCRTNVPAKPFTNKKKNIPIKILIRWRLAYLSQLTDLNCWSSTKVSLNLQNSTLDSTITVQHTKWYQMKLLSSKNPLLNTVPQMGF